ncbi:alanine racemase C-terminal domain-containing protein [Microbacterium sp. SORGH_AS_0888]|uniref:alanine racemase C-terminal domain-containing protein n=1 Tax=Microbacterium sp. SORGH_AS_0888 TaxID=3041791 RepID=UPI00278560EA|nr:alanine racemase C-terminal domain-containing protein [Microbacterium sp. SORGH_AS_0888]MDQ1129414.1 alanine racemase [Microbacterium sp. SORGH_AS_0888]
MTSPTAARVAVSRGALAANARRVAAHGGIADLRRDAYGHGAGVVASALFDAGVRSVVADERDREAVARAGLAVTDVSPTIDPRALFGLPGSAGEPALRLSASVLSVKRLRAGEGVSYNYTHIAPRDTRIALVSGGFGQGVVRALGNRVSVEIGGAVHPIVGRVAMDVCVVDVGAAPVARFDEVVYFGGAGPARHALAEWERATGLRGTELVGALGLRLAREVVA